MAHGAHPIFARFYARTSLAMERDLAPFRRELLGGLSGRVVEVGAGNGLNFAHYPPEVTGVLAVEPEPHLRRIAEANAAGAPVPIEVVDGIAERLPADDGAYDAVIASLVLCSVSDVDAALGESLRVLKPGGHLRFFEHVRSPHRPGRAVQRLLDATVWPLLGGGCHCGRDTAASIERAGFAVQRLRTLTSADTRMPFPAAPQILGVATRPRAS
jgi:ubiquinone/menaquinone biosynthesis C-methylase UbiE